jgi:hypothetical protein
MTDPALARLRSSLRGSLVGLNDAYGARPGSLRERLLQKSFLRVVENRGCQQISSITNSEAAVRQREHPAYGTGARAVPLK